jgi:hypothetical protein
MIIYIEGRWIRVQKQLEVLRSIWDLLGEDLQVHQNHVLQILEGKLVEAITLIDSVIGQKRQEVSLRAMIAKPGRTRKGKFAIRLKECIEKTIREIDKWHALFDPSWLLIIRLSSSSVEKQLTQHGDISDEDVSNPINVTQKLLIAVKENADGNPATKPIFLPENSIDLEILASQKIMFSGALQVQSSDTLVVDAACCGLDKDVRNLARVLMSTNIDDFGLLTCKGVLRDASQDTFRFVFKVPDYLRTPASLRHFLTPMDGKHSQHSLNDRFKIALTLARSVLFFHSLHFVHKNIRPEIVLIFESDDGKFDASFLIGFEKFRLEAGKTFLGGDATWEKNIYRHPKRQGLRPEEEYVMQHDIYSLEVCLLEIGLWTSFILHTPDDGAQATAKPAPFLRIEEDLKLKDERKKAFTIKRRLVQLAIEELPFKTGQRFANVVVDCLICLDKDNERFGNEKDFMDEDGIAVGVRYIEKVCGPPQTRQVFSSHLIVIDFNVS